MEARAIGIEIEADHSKLDENWSSRLYDRMIRIYPENGTYGNWV